jgi:uncharacterized protein YyaL (SSP411 family)
MSESLETEGAYLKVSRNQAVKWRTWSKKIFLEAQRKNKLILVDVGAFWARWCTIMNAEGYSNPEVVRTINEHFIPVKVDRDEAPEIDRLFQALVGGGWPLTAIVTPNGEVVFGANYLTLEDGPGGMGLKSLLLEVSKVWRKEKEKLLKNARPIIPQISSSAASVPGQEALKFEAVDDAVVKLLTDFDWDRGGLGSKHKFPHPTIDQLFLGYASRTGDQLPLQASLITLRRMYYGGILDQVGGGFHRNADENWLVPSFEKLLADNSEIMEDYLTHYLATGDHEFLDAVRLTGEYVIRELALEVGFAISQSAETQDGEGKYYTWLPNEVDEAVGPERSRFAREQFGVHPVISAPTADPFKPAHTQEEGLVEGRIVLRRQFGIEELAERLRTDVATASKVYDQLRRDMREYRERNRVKPARDENAYTHPNALAARALLYSSKAVGEEYEDQWITSANSVVNCFSGTVTRRLSSGKEGVLDDYSAALLAAISAYEVLGEPRYLDTSIRLAKELISFDFTEGFLDAKNTEFRGVSKVDSPNESPNSLAFKALLKASVLAPAEFEWSKLLDMFRRTALDLKRRKEEYVAGLYCLTDWFIHGYTHIVILDLGDQAGESLHRQALLTYYPFKVTERVRPEQLINHSNPRLRELNFAPDVSTAFVFSSGKWSQAIKKPDGLKEALKTKLSLIQQHSMGFIN